MGYMSLFQIWFPQGICLGVGLLGHMTYLTFNGKFSVSLKPMRKAINLFASICMDNSPSGKSSIPHGSIHPSFSVLWFRQGLSTKDFKHKPKPVLYLWPYDWFWDNCMIWFLLESSYPGHSKKKVRETAGKEKLFLFSRGWWKGRLLAGRG